jgi:two-component system sensor histidine kinase KdpD
VGKTFAMLQEARELRRRGSDVVVGWVQTYDRPQTLEALGDLEFVAPRTITYRGTPINEMDLDAVLKRRPQVARVDELAHTNVPGARNLKRYQDVLELQGSGIDVISTVNVQHLASLQHTIQLLAGVTVTETLPDWVLDAADEVEMIDQSPEALRKRVRHGNVQPRDQVERALDGFFRLDNLTALRELTLRRLADHNERKLLAYQRSLAAPSAETVLVCVPAKDLAQLLVRRGVHLAERLGAKLVVLHIAQPGDSRGHHEAMKALELARALGAEVQTRSAENLPQAIVACAQEVGATQIVLGEPGSSSWVRELLRGSVVRDVLRRTRNVDVHLVRRPSA